MNFAVEGDRMSCKGKTVQTSSHCAPGPGTRHGGPGRMVIQLLSNAHSKAVQLNDRGRGDQLRVDRIAEYIEYAAERPTVLSESKTFPIL